MVIISLSKELYGWRIWLDSAKRLGSYHPSPVMISAHLLHTSFCSFSPVTWMSESCPVRFPFFFRTPGWSSFIHMATAKVWAFKQKCQAKGPVLLWLVFQRRKTAFKHVFLHEGEIMELGMRWKRQRKDERKREGKEEEEDEDDEKRGRTEERIRVNEVFQSESSDKMPGEGPYWGIIAGNLKFICSKTWMLWSIHIKFWDYMGQAKR